MCDLILLHFDKHGKNAYSIPDADNREHKINAYLKMFETIDKINHYYDYINETEEPDQYQFLQQARNGNAQSAMTLICIRCDYEYEYYEVLNVQ